MVSEATLRGLHPLEVKAFLHLPPDRPFDAEQMQALAALNLGQSNQAVSWLSAKGFITEVERATVVFYERTELGTDYRTNGTPAERIVRAIATAGPLTLPQLASATGLENRDVGSTFGTLSKRGVLSMDADKRASFVSDAAATQVDTVDADLRAVLEAADAGLVAEAALGAAQRDAAAAVAKKRGAGNAAFRVVERETVRYRFTEEGRAVADAVRAAGLTGEEVGQLTPEMLRSGAWKNATFRPYNFAVPAARLVIGRRNPYCSYLDSVKDKLCALGFEEFDGPLVETEFWNSDALFMPQFHSARDIHDVYYVKEPTHATEIEEPYLSNVAAAHQNGWTTGSRGWGYDFDRDFTRRLILRSQGTVMSAKTLHKAAIPGKYFGVLRCFRYDQVDATHLSDFYQTEGIVLGEEVNLRNLLGLLKMFAEELAGATEVRYVPGYFPFTEPSVEVHIKHPVLGWFELGGSGIFRPEVTKPMGIDVPVLAWGLGIDRMALMHLGLSDLRELFSSDIEGVRVRRTTGGTTNA